MGVVSDAATSVSAAATSIRRAPSRAISSSRDRPSISSRRDSLDHPGGGPDDAAGRGRDLIAPTDHCHETAPVDARPGNSGLEDDDLGALVISCGHVDDAGHQRLASLRSSPLMSHQRSPGEAKSDAAPQGTFGHPCRCRGSGTLAARRLWSSDRARRRARGVLRPGPSRGAARFAGRPGTAPAPPYS
jgi:hypothetical protein